MKALPKNIILILLLIKFAFNTQAQKISPLNNYEQKILQLEHTEFQKLKFPTIPYLGDTWAAIDPLETDTSSLINFFCDQGKAQMDILDEGNAPNSHRLNTDMRLENTLHSFWNELQYDAVLSGISKVDTETFTSSHAKALLSKIRADSIQELKDSTNETQRALISEINKLPSLRERFCLKLKWLKIFVRVDSFFKDVNAIFNTIEFDMAVYQGSRRLSSWDEALLYSCFGEFASNCKLTSKAFFYFHMALIRIDDVETIDSTKKLNWQALLYDLLATSVENNPEIEAQYLACRLYQTSCDIFTKAKDSINAYVELLKNYSIKIFLLNNFKFYYGGDTTIPSNQADLNEILNSIARSWGNFRNLKKDVIELNYYRYKCIGNILVIEGKHDDAFTFLHTALLCAIGSRKINLTIKLLGGISYAYVKLNNEKRALEYIDSSIILGSLHIREYDYEDLNKKGLAYMNFNDPRSALIVADAFLRDSTLRHTFTPSYYNILSFWYLSLKVQALVKLKSDSINQYAAEFYLCQMQFLNELLEDTHLQSSLLISSSDFLSSHNLDIEAKKRDVAMKIAGLRVQITVMQGDSLREDSARLQTLDSLNRAKDTIVLQAKTIAAEKSNETFYTYVIAALVVCMIGTVVFFYLKSRKRKFKIERTHLNELARSKIHNFQRDIGEIEVITLSSNDKDELFWYFQRYNKFLALFSNNWKKKPFTLFDELEEFESFVALMTIKKQVKIVPSVFISKTDRVLFLNSLFDTFFHNSIRHAFVSKAEDCVFSYSIRAEKRFIICEISDNGKPANDDSEYLAGINHGLSILKRRVINYFELHKVKYRESYFQICSFEDKPGTHIKICLPYAEA